MNRGPIAHHRRRRVYAVGGAAIALLAALAVSRGGLGRWQPGLPDRYPDETLFGSWVTFTDPPCVSGPGPFAMTLTAGGGLLVQSREDGTDSYHITELRRTGIVPNVWDRGAVVLTATAADRRRVRLLFRQTRSNILEPFTYERQDPRGDLMLLASPQTLIRCDQAAPVDAGR